MVKEIIIKEVNRIFECDLMADNRKPNNINGRIAISSFIRSFSNLTTSEIGHILNKDHASICYYSKKHILYYRYDKDYRKKYDKLKEPKPNKVGFCNYTTLKFEKYQN